MKIYFDTSIINKITYDPCCKSIIEKITKKYESFISLLNCAEIAANSNESERIKLFRVAEQLCRGFYPLAHPQEILRRSLRAFRSSEIMMNFSISEEDLGVWEILKDPAKANDEIRIAAYTWINNQEHWYQKMHDEARPYMQAIIGGKLSSRSAFLRSFIRRESLMEEIMFELLKETDNVECFHGREFQVISALEPWRFFLASFCLGMYNRALQLQGFSKKKNAGSIDTQQSVYLASTEVFVTNDKAQRQMLRLIEPFGFVRRNVWHYNRLIDSL